MGSGGSEARPAESKGGEDYPQSKTLRDGRCHDTGGIFTSSGLGRRISRVPEFLRGAPPYFALPRDPGLVHGRKHAIPPPPHGRACMLRAPFKARPSYGDSRNPIHAPTADLISDGGAWF